MSTSRSSISSSLSSASASANAIVKRRISSLSDTARPAQAKRQQTSPFAQIQTKTKELLQSLVDYPGYFSFLGADHEWFHFPNTRLLKYTEHLVHAILVEGDIPTSLLEGISTERTKSAIQNLVCNKNNSLKIMQHLKNPIDLPTYADVKLGPRMPLGPGAKDVAADRFAEILELQRTILDISNQLYSPKPSPYSFGRRTGWHKMQEGEGAILCHRPASKRPNLPLKIMHEAFYEFNKSTRAFSDDLVTCRQVARSLALLLTQPFPSAQERAVNILATFKLLFPDTAEYKLVSDDNKGAHYIVYKRYSNLREDLCPDLFVINVKLEDGDGGDAYMQSSRHFDEIVSGNPLFHRTGSPIFIITMSGPNIKICGAWADQPILSADVFETHFACLDVTGKNVEKLAKLLCSLKASVELLPSHRISDTAIDVIPGVPRIFTTYQSFESNQDLELVWRGRLEADKRHSVFNVHSPEHGNCVAKIIFNSYGKEVHKALEPKYAPLLHGYSSMPGIDVTVFVMEELSPAGPHTTGWSTLSDLTFPFILDNFALICHVLNEIITALKTRDFVHGDLHADNLMIKMADEFNIAQPVEIKVVDFEWAGTLGTARYPLWCSGKSEDLIGQHDDQTAVDEWIKKMEHKFEVVVGRARAGA